MSVAIFEQFSWRDILAPHIQLLFYLLGLSLFGFALVASQLEGMSETEFRNIMFGQAYAVEELKTVSEAREKIGRVEKTEQIPQVTIQKKDPRVVAVERYLREIRSPLWNKAEKFIEVADENNLPWWLLVSICVAESGCGKNTHKPYNPFGWGQVAFSSWDEAIETVGKRLRRGYFDKGCGNLDCIHRVYNGGYENWIRNVLASKTRLNELYFMERSIK